MDGSLSLILPVRDVELCLADQLHPIVEGVVELAEQIEIWIVDDGSTDNTEEIAVELSRIYPQVRVLRLSSPVGPTEAAALGIQRSTGDVILIHDVNAPWSDETVRQLWAMRDDEELVIAGSEMINSAGHRPGPPRIDPGTKLLRREAVEELRETHHASVIINRVTRTDLGAEPRSKIAMPRRVVH